MIAQPAPEQPRTASNRHDRSSEGLDLVNLATAYADAVGAVETAQAVLAAAQDASANKTGSARELEVAQLALRGAQRKYELLRNIASVAAEAAKADLQRIQELVRAGAASSELAIETESRWKMLKTILESDSPHQAQEKQPSQQAQEKQPSQPGKRP
jgi:hypothetical protein